MTRLRRLRIERGLSVAECARRSGVSRRSWDRYESGEVSPTVETVVLLARALDVAPRWLAGELAYEAATELASE